MRRITCALLVALAATFVLSGCSFLRRHLDRKDTTYERAVQERPLEVPPDLDTPNGSGALVVPAAAASAGAAASTAEPAPSESPVEPMAAPATAVDSAPAGVEANAGGLHVADTVASTWARVGLALERSGTATIIDRDEAGHAYTVQTTGQTTVKPGWFKRMITLGHASNKKTAQVQLTVRVSADGDGSRVSVEGATDEASQDAARSLLGTLQQRLS